MMKASRNMSGKSPFRRLVCMSVLVVGLWPASQSFAEDETYVAPSPTGIITGSISKKFKEDYQKFCANNSDAVSDAKFAWQAKTISSMEAELQQVINRLEEKKNEYQSWVLRREEFISKMTNSLVKIYSSMDPEIAAAQIANVDYDTAISILTKLKPREASAILNEMDPVRASELVKVIVGAIATDENKETN